MSLGTEKQRREKVPLTTLVFAYSNGKRGLSQYLSREEVKKYLRQTMPYIPTAGRKSN
jgi:hypothetical protein